MAMMDISTFRAEITDGLAGLVRFQFEKNNNQQAGSQQAVPAFERLLADGRRNFIFDLQNVPYPSSSFIAFLVSATLRARSAHGDVKLVNVSQTAKNNLISFSSLTYLSVEEHESEAEEHLLMDGEDNDGGFKITEVDSLEVSTSEPSETQALGNIGTREEAPAAIQSHHIKVESVASNLYRLCDFVTDHAHRAGMDEKEIGKIKIAVYEACLNVIEHAYHSNPNYWIDLSVHYSPETFTIAIEDRGLAFTMPKQQDYNVEDAVQKRRTGGFGLHIIRRATDDVAYKADPVNGNRLTMVKKLR
jgi:anti-sigma regulatory factor (Ser/Thr protein kinase)/anti-anti-sigma regulatory factor